jgi:hypothetical protein
MIADALRCNMNDVVAGSTQRQASTAPALATKSSTTLHNRMVNSRRIRRRQRRAFNKRVSAGRESSTEDSRPAATRP